MTHQPEQILENELVAQLIELGYEKVSVSDEKELLINLKRQLEKHNNRQLSQNSFEQVLNQLTKGNIFEKARTLRDRIAYTDEKGDTLTLELLDTANWCKNQFQVTQQVSMEGVYRNRYDVTLLINGLPLVQIELKRRGLELKEAFNQVNRYQRHSYSSGYGLFQFIQLFVISNGVNTKYFANNPVKDRSFKQTFYWSDSENESITQLQPFAETFLEPCHLSKMISKYIVLNQTFKVLMVLRPYQYYATEAIIDRVRSTTKNGYIWHTTGSGKTLTSFKTAQMLKDMKEVEKVVFVVDRKDLDYQTTKEFNSFSKGSIDGTTNTKTLVDQLSGNHKMIVTTIQKLNNAISKKRYLRHLEDLQDKRVVFIFDECHRSQFGKTHAEIKDFFKSSQMFGFTGTPIFEDNAGTNEYGKRTTAMLFDKRLHRYVITDAIRDENVLRFAVEYLQTFRQKKHIMDLPVEAIDEREAFNAPARLEHIVDYIISNHNRKTHNRDFTGLFCVSSVDSLIEYYKLFKSKRDSGDHDLRLATIFTYKANEEDRDAFGVSEFEELGQVADVEPMYSTQHSRDALEGFIQDYNAEFGTNYTTRDSDSFYQYYNDIAKRVKAQQVDILLVVNMFLTGFDSKTLNTLYVDKNLKYHVLIQAFSRTNRILNEKKSQGNIVCFRNLKDRTDEAIALFSNKNAKEEILVAPYEDYVKKFNSAYIELLKIAPTVESVNQLPSEEERFAFIKAFRELMRIKNVLGTFSEYSEGDLSMDDQSFEDYKSKYLDLHDSVQQQKAKEKVSILDDLDFELELIHRDEINVAYILKLLAKLKEAPPKEASAQKKAIIDMVTGEVELRSKRELIEKFINEHLPLVEDADKVAEEFEAFWIAERKEALAHLSEEENLKGEELEKVIERYLFTEKEPLRDEVIGLMKVRPGLRERGSTAQRIIQKIVDFVQTFVSGGVAA